MDRLVAQGIEDMLAPVGEIIVKALPQDFVAAAGDTLNRLRSMEVRRKMANGASRVEAEWNTAGQLGVAGGFMELGAPGAGGLTKKLGGSLLGALQKGASKLGNIAKTQKILPFKEMKIYDVGSKLASSLEGVWEKPPVVRGEIIEKQLGQNLHQNFPTIDILENRVATSIKSLDLKAPSYQNMSTLRRTLTKYVDKMASFERGVLGDERYLHGIHFDKRALKMAFPKGATKAQLDVIAQVGAYAQSKNIAFLTTHIK